MIYDLSNGNVIKSGIEFDNKGRRVAYYMFKEHPGEQRTNQEVIRVPAREILHIYSVFAFKCIGERPTRPEATEQRKAVNAFRSGSSVKTETPRANPRRAVVIKCSVEIT